VSLFILDLAASFAVGGAWVLLASVAAQNFGGKLGGFIAGLPATAVIALFFITYTEGPQHGYEVTGAFTLAISINAIFLAAFAAFSKKSFSCGLMSALFIWVSVESAVLYLYPIQFEFLISFGVLIFILSLIAVNQLDTPDLVTRHVHHGIGDIAVRSGCGGGIIVLSIIGSRFGGPALGAILSAFPATVVATLIITNAYGGRDLTRVMVRPMMISGVINCMVFALAYRHLVLQMPIGVALMASYAITMVSAACTFFWINIHPRQHGSAVHNQ
jgi:uncharacterized membrane protein (GlpM family)